MDYIYSILFFLLILTMTQTMPLHHHCNSDVYSSASGMADLQQLTTLQYCVIDNCTIIRNNTGQQLDIVYTTRSHLLVTDGQTSTILISKNDPELFCPITNTTDSTSIQQGTRLIILLFIAFVNGYIAVVHMIFKELRGTFGKLLMFSSITVVCNCVNITALSITHYTVYSTFPCYLYHFLFMQLAVLNEAFDTSSLAYLALFMRYSYKSIEMSKQINKKLYKQGITFALSISLLFGFFVVTYDFGTGTYRHILSPNGHCGGDTAESEYNTVRLFYTYTYINKIAQIIILTTYFVYYYKGNKVLKNVRKMANNVKKHNDFYLKVALTMGATLGIAQVLFPITWYFDSKIGTRIASLIWLMQRCIIMSLFMCSKKMRRLWKRKLCNTETFS